MVKDGQQKYYIMSTKGWQMETVLGKLKRCREMERSGSKDRRQKRFDYQLEEAKAKQHRITQVYQDCVSRGLPNRDKTLDGLIEVEALIKRLELSMAEDMKLKESCQDALRKLPEEQRSVMESYYLDAVETWEAVAIVVNASYSTVRRLKESAETQLLKVEHF